MPEEQEIILERIDGVDYVFGSEEHNRAIDHLIERRAVAFSRTRHADRFDATGTAYLARELTYVSLEVQRVLFDKLMAASFVPIVSEVPRGAKHWTYRQTERKGKARIGASLSTNDSPRVNVAHGEFPQNTAHVDASYEYTLDELENAAYAGYELDRDRAMVCAEAIATGLDELIRVGNQPLGLSGFFNDPNVPVVTLSHGEWLTASADEIVEDWNQIEQAAITNARDNHMLTRMLLPTMYEGRVATVAKSTASDRSVLSWFIGEDGRRGNGRMIKDVRRWIKLDDATGDDVGVADPPQGVVYDPDPMNVRADIPVPYEELPPEARNYGYIVNAWGKFAGVTWKRPRAGLFIENLD